MATHAMKVSDAEIVKDGALFRATCKRCKTLIGASAERTILLILIEAHRCGATSG